MGVLDKIRLVIYRCHEKGLEIFLIEEDLEEWALIRGRIQEMQSDLTNKMIELDPVEDKNGELLQAFAIEADWHEIPSIRNLIKQDIEIVKTKLIEKIPEAEKGAYFLLKEAFKKVLPEEYQFLKELKEVIRDHNLTKYI